jgi:hypothetical protein
MGEAVPRSLEDQLRDLADTLNANQAVRTWSPEAFEQLGKVVEILGLDLEVLEKFGYLNINQACTRLCDLFQNNEVLRIKSLTHCGRRFSFHVFQTYVRCPVCLAEIKTAQLLGEDDPAGVAVSAWHWLGMKTQSVPGWNSEVQNSWYDSKPQPPDPPPVT